jgi:hypothetical protein
MMSKIIKGRNISIAYNTTTMNKSSNLLIKTVLVPLTDRILTDKNFDRQNFDRQEFRPTRILTVENFHRQNFDRREF